MKILLVSDDVLFARLAASKLEKWGHRVIIEASGESARERIKKEPFRAVITGWDVGGTTGPDLCRYIRKLNRTRYTYTIIYTSKSDKDSMMAGLQAGADDYLTRPFNALELELRLKAAKRLLNLEDELRESAGTDSSTGLVNEASFRQFFRVMLAEAERTESGGALMFVYVENYTEMLEKFGMGPTQKVMVEVSKALNRTIRISDLIARTSDSRFCLALQNTYWERCVRVAEKIMNSVDNMSVHIEDAALRPQVRIDIINYPRESMTSDEIIDSPDRTHVDRSDITASKAATG
ncbi:MAG: diguanylate cyclase domain-containing protein [Alphaproteobacteria bacterium]